MGHNDGVTSTSSGTLLLEQVFFFYIKDYIVDYTTFSLNTLKNVFLHHTQVLIFHETSLLLSPLSFCFLLSSPFTSRLL